MNYPIVVEVLARDGSPLIRPELCTGWREALSCVCSWRASNPSSTILATHRGRTARFLPRKARPRAEARGDRCLTCGRSPRLLAGGRCEVCCSIEYGIAAYCRSIDGRARVLEALRAAGFEVTIRRPPAPEVAS